MRSTSTRFPVWVVTIAVAGLTPSGGTSAARADERSEPKSGPAGTIGERFRAILDEYQAARDEARNASAKETTEFGAWKAYGKRLPDESAFSRRMVDLAAGDPKDPAARDALLWVLDKPGMGPGGPYNDEFTRAALLLLRHHADDPDVARLGLQLDNIFTPGRDLFLEGLYVRAKGREAKALARFALGNYLAAKAKYAAGVREAARAGRLRDVMRIETYDDKGKRVEKEFPLPPEDLAYRVHLRLCDPDAIRAEAKRLLEEVARDDADLPLVSRQTRKLQELLKEPAPSRNGKPLTAAEVEQVKQRLVHRRTLGEGARAKLDEMENLTVGRPAPPIDGTGMDGRPLRLADYRGKVVVLVFWGTWCGPCMREVPHERALAERFKDRPFALLGVDCDGDKAAALGVMKREGITWPNWNDGDPGEGPIARSYHVHGFPTTYVIDGHGIIRHIGLIGSGLEKAVGELLDAAAKDRAPRASR